MRRTLLLAALLGVLLRFTAATSCTWKGYDFSALAADDIVGGDGSGLYAYHLRLCGALRSPPPACSSLSPRVAACQMETGAGGSGWAFVAGEWGGTAEWRMADEHDPWQGVQYSMTGQQTCWISAGVHEHYKTVVHLKCAREAGALRVSVDGCTQTYTLPTPLACPAPSPPAQGCQWSGFDFSELSKADLETHATDGGFDFRLRVCGVLTDEACMDRDGRPDPFASACRRDSVVPEQRHGVLGHWHGSGAHAQWSFIDPSLPARGVQYDLIGAESCWSEGRHQPFRSTVRLECARHSGPLRVDMDETWCQHNFTVPTLLACPEALRSRLALE